MDVWEAIDFLESMMDVISDEEKNRTFCLRFDEALKKIREGISETIRSRKDG